MGEIWERDAHSGYKLMRPCTSAQKRLWAIYLMAPGSSAYNSISCWQIRGRVDWCLLERCVQQVVDRHDSLRTTFGWKDDEPVQVISHTSHVSIETFDGTGATEDGAHRLVRHVANRPFSLERGPVYRFARITRDADTSLFLFSIHHIATDGWSDSIIASEVTALYARAATGLGEPLLPPSVAFSDYVRVERRLMETSSFEEGVAYWSRYLADCPGPPDMQSLGPHTSRPETRTTVEISLPAPLSRSVAAYSRKNGTTLFATLISAFAVLMQRYLGIDEIVIGYPVANRPDDAAASVVGLFVNTLVLRVNILSSDCFKAILERVSMDVFAAQDHQEVPFDEIVRRSSVVRAAGTNPVFQLMFALDNVSGTQLVLSDTEIKSIYIPCNEAKFPLSLSIRQNDSDLDGTFIFDPQIVAHEIAERLAISFEALLTKLIADDLSNVYQLSICDDARGSVPVHSTLSRPSQADPIENMLLHRAVEAVALRAGDGVAVVAGEASLTYAQLNEISDAVAHRLLEAGLRQEELVGILCQPSVELVAGILGILKAGGAFVPLDPAAPANRRASIADEARLRMILTHTALNDACSGLSGIATIFIDQIASHRERTCELRSAQGTSSRQRLAYCLYTSGSTGQPKGVGVSHEAIMNFLLGFSSVCCHRPGDRVLQMASIGFDVAVGEIFMPLLRGATVVMRPCEVTALSCLEGSYLSDARITILHLTTEVWHLWVSTLTSGRMTFPASLRLLIIGGEAARRDLLEEWLRLDLGQKCRLINGYGPTETAVAVTWFENWHVLPPGTPPIGYPLPEAAVHVLNEEMEIQPPGAVGEIFIGGINLARGYLNSPGQTAEVFVPNPYGQPGSRLYRTGDRGYFHANGVLKYLGRTDQQVKIRGYRIELEEVEQAIGRMVGGGQVMVSTEKTPTGGNSLIAFVGSDSNLDVEKIKRGLAAHLPSFMMPAKWYIVSKLPLTPNGKLDRKATVQLKISANLYRKADMAIPETHLERQIAAEWRSLLGVTEISVNDDFFEIGGDSLMALRFARACSREYGWNITASDVFRFPTIALLAANKQNLGIDRFIEIHPGVSEMTLCLIHDVTGMVSNFFELCGGLHRQVRLLALDSDLDCLNASTEITDLASIYAGRLSGITGTLTLGGYSFGCLVAVELARLLMQRNKIAPPVLLIAPPQHPRTPLSGGSCDVSIESLVDAEVRRLAEAKKLAPADLAQLRVLVSEHLTMAAAGLQTPLDVDGVILQPSNERLDVGQWSSLLRSIRIIEVPGDHYSIFYPDNAMALAHAINTIMIPEQS